MLNDASPAPLWPGMISPFLRQRYVSAVPVAVALKVALVLTSTAWATGCLVIAGAIWPLATVTVKF